MDRIAHYRFLIAIKTIRHEFWQPVDLIKFKRKFFPVDIELIGFFHNAFYAFHLGQMLVIEDSYLRNPGKII